MKNKYLIIYNFFFCLVLLFTACSKDTPSIKELVIPQGWEKSPYMVNVTGPNYGGVLIFNYVSPDGVDLLEQGVDGALDIENLTVSLNGNALLYLKDYTEIPTNICYYSFGYGEKDSPDESRRNFAIVIDQISFLKLKADTWHEIVFDWGESIGKDVIKFQFKRLENYWIEQYFINSAPIKRDGEVFIIIK